MRIKKNKRHQTRGPAYIIAEYHVQEGVFRDIIKNIGANGIFISTQRRIAVNQQIKLRFPLFSFQHEIVIVGKVIRSSPIGFAASFENPIHGLICKEGEFPDIVHEIDRNQD